MMRKLPESNILLPIYGRQSTFYVSFNVNRCGGLHVALPRSRRLVTRRAGESASDAVDCRCDSRSPSGKVVPAMLFCQSGVARRSFDVWTRERPSHCLSVETTKRRRRLPLSFGCHSLRLYPKQSWADTHSL